MRESVVVGKSTSPEVLSLPWYCPEKPEVVLSGAGQSVTEYTFQCDFPEIDGKRIESEVLRLGKDDVSFELTCRSVGGKRTYYAECR